MATVRWALVIAVAAAAMAYSALAQDLNPDTLLQDLVPILPWQLTPTPLPPELMLPSLPAPAASPVLPWLEAPTPFPPDFSPPLPLGPVSSPVLPWEIAPTPQPASSPAATAR